MSVFQQSWELPSSIYCVCVCTLKQVLLVVINLSGYYEINALPLTVICENVFKVFMKLI